MTIKDGGPAFPHSQVTVFDAADSGHDEYKKLFGMSLRDYFAAAALTGYRAALCVNAGAYPSETKLWGPAQAARGSQRRRP